MCGLQPQLARDALARGGQTSDVVVTDYGERERPRGAYTATLFECYGTSKRPVEVICSRE